MSKAVLLGSPNVGKSVIFNYLTGAYATVSNYPGTTVDISRGECRIYGRKFEIIDTPGIYSLMPITEEEKVTRNLLQSEKPDLVIHVIDAKNIRRMLNLTLSLMEAGLPVMLVINIMDEAKKSGMLIQIIQLADILQIPVVGTAAAKKIGLDNLKKAIACYTFKPAAALSFSAGIENSIAAITDKLLHYYGMPKRMVALLLLQQDPIMLEQIKKEPQYSEIIACISTENAIVKERQFVVDEILNLAVMYTKPSMPTAMDRLGRLTRQPLRGIPVQGLILYLGLYKFVGEFGAGVLVDYLDERIFSLNIAPCVEEFISVLIPYEWARSMIIGEYGLFSWGIRYAVVIVLPIVGTFFLMFALLEDSGYLPRLAMLADGLFKNLGLNGRAVIPMTLGFGCGTMAVMVTRTLESKRERLLATFLLSLSVPCSAQLGLMLSLLAHNLFILTVWYIYTASIFLLAGWLAAKLIPGKSSYFYMEIPPLRFPVLSNVLVKAYTRMLWYFIEVLPVFLFTSLIMWMANRSGILAGLIQLITPLMQLLGLPSQLTPVFILGFFRRDYGAAGLYDLSASGLLTDNQLLTAAVVLTLFLPCVAQFVVMVKERGLIASLCIGVSIFFTALLAGGILNYILQLVGLG